MENGNVRRPTFPRNHAKRHKPRRLPLILRFTKGAVHRQIALPVLLHSIETAVIVFLDRYVGDLGLPNSLIPSLSLVVGLMLVFRNGTSYDRFWTGRHCLTSCITSVRNIARVVLVHARATPDGQLPTEAEKIDTEKTIRILVAILYAIKSNLRNEFCFTTTSASAFISDDDEDSLRASRGSIANTLVNSAHSTNTAIPSHSQLEFAALLPPDLVGFEDLGLGLPFQLAVMVESYIRRGMQRGWWNPTAASQLTMQLHNLTDAYGKMETIRTTPIPIAHQIHQKQVLALFVGILPFAIVDDFQWWTILIVGIVAFTLYGIEGIGSQLEDPFGYDKNDIKMDGVVEDARQEIMTLLDEYMSGGKMFE